METKSANDDELLLDKNRKEIERLNDQKTEIVHAYQRLFDDYQEKEIQIKRQLEYNYLSSSTTELLENQLHDIRKRQEELYEEQTHSIKILNDAITQNKETDKELSDKINQKETNNSKDS